MAVALEGHEFVDLDGAKLRHAPHVVARKVDEHHMLGTFFRVFAQFAGEASVVFVIASAFACASDWPAGYSTVAKLHQWFGRTSGDGQRRVPHEVHIWARVHLPQDAVEIERVGVEREIESLRQHHLKDVAGDDVLFRDPHRLLIPAIGHRRRWCSQRVAARWLGNICNDGLCQVAHHSLHRYTCVVVGLVDC